MTHRRALLALATALAAVQVPAPAAMALTGGPDAYGYTFIDSDEPGGPAYSWIDITATGTQAAMGDDDDVTIPLPFVFTFYGRPYSDVTVGDGVIVLGDDSGVSNENGCVPADNTLGDDTLIMGMWHDLNAEWGGGVYHEVIGAAPDRTLVVTYDAVAPYYASDTEFTFQFLLRETSNEVVLQFASVTSDDPDYTLGAAATVGIQADLAYGLEYSCESDAVLHDELAVSFDVVCDDLDGDGMGACDGDCDDADPAVGPHATEVDDGRDDDCDGLVDEDFVAPGDVVVAEFMCNPRQADDQDGEWFEVLNTSMRNIDLQGWTLTDEDGRDGIEESLVIGAGEIALFAVNGDSATNGGLPTVDAVYSFDAVRLTNVGATLTLWMGQISMDQLAYDADIWSTVSGRSTFLDADYADADLNDSPFPWCLTPDDGTYDYGGGPGDHGTPGEPNPVGLCCADVDGDGSSTCDGDCDDEEAAAHPDLAESEDGVDNDCDGLVDEDFIAAGDVLISEFLDDPWQLDDRHAEWLELYNPGDRDVYLGGWRLTDGDGVGITFDEPLVIPAGGYAVLAPNDNATLNGQLPQVDLEYEYGEFILSSTDDDEIVLWMGDTLIDEVAYSNLPPWPSAPGRSTFLRADSLDAVANDDVISWCLTSADPSFEYGGDGWANHGTPGSANPSGDEDADADGVSVCQGDCDDGDSAVVPEATEVCDDGVDNDCDGWIDVSDSECSLHASDDDDAVGDDDSAGLADGDCSCRVEGRRGATLLTVILLAGAVGVLRSKRLR